MGAVTISWFKSQNESTFYSVLYTVQYVWPVSGRQVKEMMNKKWKSRKTGVMLYYSLGLTTNRSDALLFTRAHSKQE